MPSMPPQLRVKPSGKHTWKTRANPPGFGAIAFSFLIVHDTQLIFGESALNPGAKRQIEYSVDMSLRRGRLKWKRV